MSYSAEQVRILTERCEQFRGSKAPDGYPDSLALCIVDSVQSTMVRYPTVEKGRRPQRFGGDYLVVPCGNGSGAINGPYANFANLDSWSGRRPTG